VVGMALVERYAERESAVHRASARVKVAATVGYIFAVTATPEGAWGALVLLALPLFTVMALARLGPVFVLRRTFLALPFVLVALPLVFTRPGEPLFTLPVLGWSGTREGAEAVATIMARSWIAVAAAVLLTATTSVTDLLQAIRSLGLPRLLVSTVAFTYRYVFVLGDEAARMMRARESRSAALPGRAAGRSVWWRGRILGYMVGSLFVRSLERSERVHAAMQARGYDGEVRILRLAPPLRAVEVAAAGSLVLYGGLVQLGTRLA
jgi:cobalt/nickel transport system permease protein